MEVKVNAVVLRSVDYKDNDKIVTLFSLEKGIVCAGVKGVKKAGSKLKFAVEPFCFAEYVFAEKGDRLTVTQATQLDSFYNIRLDIKKYYSACAVTEFLMQTLYEGVPSPELFLLVCDTLKKIAYSIENPKILLADFFVKALKIHGYAMSFNGCRICGGQIVGRSFFDFETGGAECVDCHTEASVECNVETYNLLRCLEVDGIDTVDTLKIPPMIEKKVLRLLDYYLKLKTGAEIGSLKTLINM